MSEALLTYAEQSHAKHLPTIWLLGSHLGISTHTAPEQLGYVLAYFSGFSGALLLFFVVTKYTTAGEIYSHLSDRLLWTDTVGSVGLGPMSHLFLRIQVPGGATDAPEASSRSRRDRNTKRLDEFIELEKLDEFGNPEATKQSTKRKRPHKRQNPLPAENSDPDDLDYSADDNSSSDDDIQEIISNEELADSLPSKTLPESSRRPKDSAPPKKKSKGKGKAPDPLAASSSIHNIPSTSSQPVPQPPKARRKTRNPIYYFFEEVNENSDGSVEENARYFKCYLGNRRVLKIGQKMNGSTHGTKTFVRLPFSSKFSRLANTLSLPFRCTSPPLQSIACSWYCSD
ncbi:hypothetical protein B0H14DRAFT_3135922 [Mycena olivaceomarginata]|nr:hypothetical protein B0H14DRAFT_3135922 [Mycena olivaceomarginata]